MLQGLADDGAKLHIYDPKVTKTQIMKDLSTPKFEWDHPSMQSFHPHAASESVTFHTDVYSACKGAHAMAILTEWDEFKTLYPALLNRNNVTVKGIGISGMGPCIAVTDTNDKPVAPAALYGVDQRARTEIAELADEFGQDFLLERYDSQLTTQAAGPKLLWFAQRHPQVFASGARFYMPASWIIKHITGQYVLDRHSASQCTPLYNPATREWDEQMVQKIAPGTELPRLGWSHEICGETVEVAEVPELKAGIPVIFGTVDAWAEQESVGAIKITNCF